MLLFKVNSRGSQYFFGKALIISNITKQLCWRRVNPLFVSFDKQKTSRQTENHAIQLL